MNYCYACKAKYDWPGGFQTAPNGPCEAAGHIGDRNVPCYQYDSRLLTGTESDINALADREAAAEGGN